MNIFDRIVLTIYMLAMALLSLCIIVLPFNLIPLWIIDSIKGQLLSNWYYSLVGLVLFIVSVRLLVSGISTNKRNKKGITKPAEFGDVKISIDTFESLSLRVIKQIAGIKDVKVRISIISGELAVNARLLVMPDVNIPQVIGEVQSKIKDYIESTTEINVKEVKVSVDNVASTSATRVD